MCIQVELLLFTKCPTSGVCTFRLSGLAYPQKPESQIFGFLVVYFFRANALPNPRTGIAVEYDIVKGSLGNVMVTWSAFGPVLNLKLSIERTWLLIHWAAHELLYAVNQITHWSIDTGDEVKIIIWVKIIPNISFETILVSSWTVQGFRTMTIFNIVEIAIAINIATSFQTTQEISIWTLVPVVISIFSKGTCMVNTCFARLGKLI